MRDQRKVSTLWRGVMLPVGSTPIHLITRWHLLSSSSHTRSPVGLSCGKLSLKGGLRAYHVASERQSGLGRASPPVVQHLRQVS